MKIPVSPPSLHQLLQIDTKRLTDILLLKLGPDVGGKYEHWDHLRYLTPPVGLTSDEWWLGLKLARRGMARKLPLADKTHSLFSVSITPAMQEKLHFLDREAAGAILGPQSLDPDAIRKRYLMRSLIEEAMTSSQLEGASTTRQIAKEMLSTGRSPRDRSEQMIYNNFQIMQAMQDWKTQPLTSDLIFAIHRRLMSDAMDDPSQAGRLRTAEDNVVVQDRLDPTITLHVPPQAAELPDRLEALCKFANDSEQEFLHPIVRAIALHFQIGYDHPFCDGNGRTARALFYWSMLRSGYWLSEYVSISSVLRKAPGKYVTAYLHTETDDSDLSYFVEHQLGVIEEAVNSLRAYLAKKSAENRQAESLLRPASPLGAKLNHRQRALLLNAIRHPDSVYDVASHQTAHRVSQPTARSDLLGLVNLKLLHQVKRGKSFAFFPAKDLAVRMDGREIR